jgi:hypothetical protein
MMHGPQPEMYEPHPEADKMLDTFVIANWRYLAPPELPTNVSFKGATLLIALGVEHPCEEHGSHEGMGMIGLTSEKLDLDDLKTMVRTLVMGLL